MKHILLKFNYAVEIGARLAYLGHYKVTNDENIKQIADEELAHREAVKWVLKQYDEKPFFLFNWIFYFIGNIIQLACYFSPRFMLDYVARSMELFAVFNYKKLGLIYPDYYELFKYLEDAEEQHRLYFTNKS